MVRYRKVTFEQDEFENAYPETAALEDLNESDKVRVALGLPARRAKAGAPRGNKNNPRGRRREADLK